VTSRQELAAHGDAANLPGNGHSEWERWANHGLTTRTGSGHSPICR